MTGEGGPVPVEGIAVTAIGVAIIRARETARTDRLYADPLAQAFVDAAREGFDPPRWARLTALADDFYEGRTLGVRVVDDRVRKAVDGGIRQFVLLGAGLDTRAFRMDLPAGAMVFEIDLPETFAFKEPVLDRTGAVTTCTRKVVVADLQKDWDSALQGSGFDAQQPTCWVDEGTLGNLTQQWTRRVVELLTEMSAAGSRFAVGRQVVDPDSPRYREYRRLVAGDAAEPDSARESAPPEFDDEQWLQQLGWATEFHSWNDLVAPFGRGGAVSESRVGTIEAVRR